MRRRFLIIKSKLKPRNKIAATGMREIMNQAIPVNGMSLDQGLARFSVLLPVLPASFAGFDCEAAFASEDGASGVVTTKTGNGASFALTGKSGLAACRPRFSQARSEKTFFPAWSIQTFPSANTMFDSNIRLITTKSFFIFRTWGLWNLAGLNKQCQFGADDIRAVLRKL